MSVLSRGAFLAALFACMAGCGGSSSGLATTPSTPAPPVAATATPASTPPTSGTRTLATNDVSILFPLGRGELWSAAMAARGGALLPRSAFDLITQRLVRQLAQGDSTYNAMRVVSMRIDPCFSTPCRPQIRFVFQATTGNDTNTFDGSIHALYDLSSAGFARVRDRLLALTALAPENAAVERLDVSPSLSAQGMASPYASALRDLAVEFAGEANLAKLTFMTQEGGGDRWTFGGFNIVDFDPKGSFPISGIDGSTTFQVVNERSNSGQVTQTYSYTVAPSVLRGGLASVLSAQAALVATAADRQAGLDAVARVENPLLASPDTVDCSACHLANRIHVHLRSTFALTSPAEYASVGALRLSGGADTVSLNLRAFGYFDSLPAIAQRTANETAEVLRAMR